MIAGPSSALIPQPMKLFLDYDTTRNSFLERKKIKTYLYYTFNHSVEKILDVKVFEC